MQCYGRPQRVFSLGRRDSRVKDLAAIFAELMEGERCGTAAPGIIDLLDGRDIAAPDRGAV
jgi:hypothetical protein